MDHSLGHNRVSFHIDSHITKPQNPNHNHSYDHTTGKISPDIVEQTEQIFRTIDKALCEAGATMADVVRVRYILPDAKQFPLCWPVTRKWLGEVKPAATMIQAGLMDEEMKIEIEVTARRGDSTED
jgi:enamine deaminase RidA (YjgF/YER057c/UK114 family)